MYPNFNEEKHLLKKNHKIIAGLDEVGRGALAGPVIAAVVVFDFKKILKFDLDGLNFIKDSKKLTPKKRETIYKFLTKNPFVKYAIGKVSEQKIDKLNILEATKIAMEKAIRKLDFLPHYLILDGTIRININIHQKNIVKADEKVFSCAAASIIAKVERDRFMEKMHKKYPKYGFNRHKGYGTDFHKKMIKKYGPCKIHRRSFKPIKDLSL